MRNLFFKMMFLRFFLDADDFILGGGGGDDEEDDEEAGDDEGEEEEEDEDEGDGEGDFLDVTLAVCLNPSELFFLFDVGGGGCAAFSSFLLLFERLLSTVDASFR
jgi:hypothetical protein